MTCPKCGGLVVPGDFEDEQKCVACGKRIYHAGDPMSYCLEPGCDTQTKGAFCFEHKKDAVSAKDSRCAPNDNGTPKKRGWTPERRAKFMATARRKKGLPPEPALKPVRAGEQGEPDPAPREGGVKWPEWKASVVAQIDQAIAQLEDQLQKTKAAREAVAAL